MIIPQNDWIAVEVVEETKKGLMFIPETARNTDAYRVGRITALPPEGDADFNYNVTATVGDLIIYDTRTTVEGKANGEDFIFARARDVIARIS